MEIKNYIESEESANTFSDVKKSSEESNIVPFVDKLSNADKNADSADVSIRYITDESSKIIVQLDELEFHKSNQEIYLEANTEQIKLLAQNIKEFSLINRIIINKKMQILSGKLRFQALRQLNETQTEVYVIDINEKDELDFIISSNQQRERTVIDARNEINSLYEKYSPGQGSRDSNGENTIKKIASITGYSTNKISTIRKIDKTFPSLLGEVYKGNMTLNSALKKCDVVEDIRILSEELKEDLLKDLSVDKIDDVFDKSVKACCKISNPEYYEMITKNQMSTRQAFDKLYSSKKPKESEKTPYDPITGRLDDSMFCPCCVQKVRKDNKELKWIKEWNQSIIEFIANLKLPAND